MMAAPTNARPIPGAAAGRKTPTPTNCTTSWMRWRPSPSGGNKLMCLEPVFAGSHFHNDGNAQGDGRFHFLLHQRPHLGFLGLIEVKHQLVMDLEEHAGLEAAAA